MIQKPISVLRVDFINNLINLINTSELPAYILEPILKDALEDVRILMRKQYKEDHEAYHHALEEEQETQDTAKKEAEPTKQIDKSSDTKKK